MVLLSEEKEWAPDLSLQFPRAMTEARVEQFFGLCLAFRCNPKLFLPPVFMSGNLF